MCVGVRGRVCVFLTTRAEEEEHRFLTIITEKRMKAPLLWSRALLSGLHAMQLFFYSKTQRERVLIYFITFYERSFYSVLNSIEIETKKYEIWS